MKNLIVANWKMNPASQKEAEDIFEGIKNGVEGAEAEVVICPPFIYLSELKGLTLGAQNIFYREGGAFTSGISGAMLKDLGVEYVIIGHSESRRYLKETDEIVNLKIKEALKYELKIIFCVGETAEERDAGKKNEVLGRQLKTGLADTDNSENISVAYEPIWAIGTGKAATGTQANETIGLIRHQISKSYSKAVAQDLRILYGGSVTAANATEFMQQTEIDGALVGGASLKAAEFLSIVKQTSQIRR